MYPSDYGYATSGGQINDRKSCLNFFGDSWKSLNECFENNYLYKSYYHQWSLTHNVQSMAEIFRIYRGGNVTWIGAKDEGSGVRPTLFLKSNISIGIGDGSSNNPYQLSL